MKGDFNFKFILPLKVIRFHRTKFYTFENSVFTTIWSFTKKTLLVKHLSKKKMVAPKVPSDV